MHSASSGHLALDPTETATRWGRRPLLSRSQSKPTRLLRPGQTCWRLSHTDRLAFLIDAEAYFDAVAAAIENATRRVWLLGWDFHSAVRLRRGETGGARDQLVPLLEARVRACPTLHVYVLGWDFAMLYALEREFLPLLQFGTRTHRRIHFELDSAHPLAGSQHQKIAVVDDAIAFVGGLDLTSHRWDTREHAPDDPRRVTPAGKPYPPFHDVQLAVDGQAAASLAELAGERWKRATGGAPPTLGAASDPWPVSLDPSLRNVEVGIARTLPSHRGSPEIREVEALYRDAIASARQSIYLENQYFTAPRMADWLAARLREAAGPEVLIVGPRQNTGWLEANTMGALRDRAVRTLQEADLHGRLRFLFPHHDGLSPDQMINVHSKLMVVDDHFVRVGSSNISNRSFGLDSECDLAFEAVDANARDDVRSSIAGFRDDLLAEHLGSTGDEVRQAIERSGSLLAGVDALCGGSRTLRPLEPEAGDWAASAVRGLGAIDPEHPAPLEELVERFHEESSTADARNDGRSLWSLLLVLGVVALVALIWPATPMADWTTPERLSEAFSVFREGWRGPFLAFGAFALASVLLVPVTALTVATGLALDPVTAFFVAWGGSVAAAAIGHLIGASLWRETVRRVAGRRLNELSRRLGRSGLISTALLRLVPVAPFMVVNLVAGASHVRFRDFVLGTTLGMLPGTALLIAATHGITALVSRSTGPVWLWMPLAVLAAVGAFTGLRLLAGHIQERAKADS